MTPDEVIAQAQKLGAKVSRTSLLRYEKARLIPTALKGSLGRGKGGFAEYPEGTVDRVVVVSNLFKCHATIPQVRYFLEQGKERQEVIMGYLRTGKVR